MGTSLGGSQARKYTLSMNSSEIAWNFHRPICPRNFSVIAQSPAVHRSLSLYRPLYEEKKLKKSHDHFVNTGACLGF